MKYMIWIGLVMAFLAVCTVATPLWWILLALGVGANGLVCAANEWKMPVRGIHVESPRHAPMTTFTRYKFLADIIPVGFGKASVGDFLLWAGFLGAWAHRLDGFTYIAEIVLSGYLLWVFGWSKGFRLTDKWDRAVVVDSKKNLPIIIMLMLAGNLLGVHGCSVKEMAAAVPSMPSLPNLHLRAVEVKPIVKTSHSLGNLASPPTELLRRLREQTAKQSRQAVERAIKDAQMATTTTFVDASGNRITWSTMPTTTQKKSRSGPFCRVTCAAHHGGQYDVETLPEACTVNWIPPTAEYVPGWQEVSATEEVANPWPGPAQSGFENYKLYWSGLQSAAKVVHKSDPLSAW